MLPNSESTPQMQESNGARWERPDAPLGTLVYRAGLLSKEKLESALQEGQRTGRRLGEILLQKGWIDEKDLARLLAGQKGLQFVSLKGRGYEPETARLLPERISRFHTALAMEASADRVLVAIADPTDDSAVQEIRDEIGRPVELVVAPTSEIRSALDDVFGSGLAPAPVTPVVAPTPVELPGDLGLRIASPPPEPEPEPEGQPEPELEPAAEAAPAPVEEAPVAEPEIAPIAAPAPDSRPEPPTVEAPAPTVIPTLGEPTAAPPAVEPTIERNEEAHVSVAFHTAPVPAQEPAPPAEPAASPLETPVAVPEPLAVPEPEPVAQTAAEPASSPAPESEPAVAAYRLVLNLDGGDEVDVGYFADPAEATAAARALVAGMKEGEWPQVDRTFYPPDRIASVEIRERQRFTGSVGRAAWGSDTPA